MPNSNFPKIGSPATRALEAAGYTSLKQLTKVTEAELAQLHGMGPKALGILREALKVEGLSFKQGKAGEKLRKKGSPVSRTDKVENFYGN
jgi:ERCC4-type nuclease